MTFYFKAAQNLVAEHYERDFDMTFHLKVAQNLVAEHYERDFNMIYYLKKEVKEIWLTGLALMAINNKSSVYFKQTLFLTISPERR